MVQEGMSIDLNIQLSETSLEVWHDGPDSSSVRLGNPDDYIEFDSADSENNTTSENSNTLSIEASVEGEEEDSDGLGVDNVDETECEKGDAYGGYRIEKQRPAIEQSSSPSNSSEKDCSTDQPRRVDNLFDALEKRLSVGSNIRDLEEGYLLYCEYGRVKGFGVRKGLQRYIGNSETVKWKEFLCCCAGLPDCKRSTRRVPSYKKLVVRSDCKARVRFSRLGSIWRVSRFDTVHNHELVKADQTYLFRSARHLSHAHITILESLHSAGIGLSGACRFLEKESGGPENLGFIRRDVYNHFGNERRKSKIENADSVKLLEYFTSKSNEEPFFFWKAETDEEGRLMNFFFRDGRCAEDYQAFGDVLSVDTTFRTNKYKLVCAPFVGINHHTFTVMFGMGFLSDETASSFEWLFDQFLKSMKGCEPKVIFTDQCNAMMKAIEKIFPNSKHRLCQWHINRNATKRFGSLNGDASFKKLWYKCMNGVENETEFDEVWKELLSHIKQPSKDTKNWFNGMYEMRHRWASVFTRGTFTAGLLATSRSEGTNRCIKDRQSCTDSLFDFVCNYENMKLSWRRREKEEDTLGIWNPGQLVSNNELFEQAASCYTRRVYKVFESEATRSFDVIISHDFEDLGDGRREYSLRAAKQGRWRKVIHDKSTNCCTCSCSMWESEGIFCRHILKVYYHLNIFKIPESQILKRWTKKAKEGCFVEKIGNDIRSTLPYMLFLHTVMRHVYEMASNCHDNEQGRTIIIQKIESLRRELFEEIGLQPPAKKSKFISEGASMETFMDPKPILEKGTITARRRRTGDAEKNPQLPTSQPTRHSVPRIPFQMREQTMTSPSNLEMPEQVIGSRTSPSETRERVGNRYEEHPAGWITHNPRIPHFWSQP